MEPIIRAARLNERSRVMRRAAASPVAAGAPAAVAPVAPLAAVAQPAVQPAAPLPDDISRVRAELVQRERGLAERERTLVEREQALAAAQAALAEQAGSAAEQGRAQGYEAGLVQGRATAAEDAAQQLGQRLAMLDKAAAELAAAAALRAAAQEDDTVALAFEIACKLLGSSLVQREGVQALVQQALRAMQDAGPLEVRVHPGELAWLQPLGHAAGIRWLADPAIDGGCVVQAAGGSLDARLDQQLERLCGSLRAARARQAGTAE